MSDRRCDRCQFFKQEETNSDDGSAFAGQCRRRPPSADSLRRTWPRVYAEDWCGEFRDAELGRRILEIETNAALRMAAKIESASQ